MPGISGIVTSGGKIIEDPHEVSSTFERVHALRGAQFHHRAFHSRHCVISNLLTGLLKSTLDQPAEDPARRAVLFLEGEIFNLDEVCPLVKEPFGQAPCQVLLALFLERGPDFAALLDGHFNIVVYEEGEHRLTLVSDRFSSKPLYYKEEDGDLLFASEKKSILAVGKVSPRIDSLGILQIFAHRHNLSGRTFIEGLWRLPSSSCLEYRDGRLAVRRYEKLQFSVPSSPPPTRTLIKEWSSCLVEDMKRRLRGKERVLISLSGGLDSRAFTCAIPRDFRPLWARTRGPADSREFLCAAEITRRLGILHYREDPADVPYSQLLPRAVWRTECEVNFIHCTSLASHARIKEHGDFIFAGQAGEIVAGGHIYPFMLVPRGRREFLERTFRWYLGNSEKELCRIFNEDLVRRMFPAIKEAFMASFDPHDGDNNTDVYQVWNLAERQPRMTLSAGPSDGHLFEKVYALLGRKYTDYALRLPLRFRYGQNLYQAMIHELGPEVRDVPYANTNLPLRRTLIGNLGNKGLYLGRRAVEKCLVRLGLAKAEQYVADRDNLPEALRADPEFRRGIEGFVGSSCFDPDIFNGPGILRLLEDHYSGAIDRAKLLCYLATFTAGLPRFVYGRPVACPEEAEPVPAEIAELHPAVV